jgi:tetratricopeptide (TPR) repeat protein
VVANLEAGRLREASDELADLLGVDPLSPEALVLFARVLLRAGQARSAAAFAQQAVAVQRSADTYAVRGATAQALGRYEDAEQDLRTAISFDPGNESRHNALGVLLRQRGDVAEALGCFERATQVNPASHESHNNFATACMEMGRIDGAVTGYRRAVQLRPDVLVYRLNLGIALKERGDLAEAEQCFGSALEADANNADALNNLAALYLKTGRVDAAEFHLRQCIALQPGLPEAHLNLGELHTQRGQSDLALDSYRQALAHRPDWPDALCGLAETLRRIDIVEAESACRRAIALDPHRSASFVTLGQVLRERGRPLDAEEAYRTALRMNPANAAASYNLAILRLAAGAYQEGFELYESRFAAFGARAAGANGFNERLGIGRRWRGGPLDGKRILIWTEQGFGDSLMMLRYLPLLCDRGASQVIVVAPSALTRLISRVNGVTRVLSGDSEIGLDEFDLHCPIMSLPHCFGTRQRDAPSDVPPIPLRAHSAQNRLHLVNEAAPLRVGLVWAGSPTLEDDSSRSIPATAFGRLREVPGVQLVSLQKERGYSDEVFGEGHQAIDKCIDFLDTAALIETLDLVIAVDTAVAHLAGTMGKPVWLLTRLNGDWRWGIQGDTTPWYPTMRIFRQRTHGDWKALIDEVATSLKAYEVVARSRQ